MDVINLDKLDSDELYNLLESVTIDGNVSETDFLSDEDDEPAVLSELSNVPPLDFQLETNREAEDRIFPNHFNYDNYVQPDYDTELSIEEEIDEREEHEPAEEDENSVSTVSGGSPETEQQVIQIPNHPSEAVYDVPLIDRFRRVPPKWRKCQQISMDIPKADPPSLGNFDDTKFPLEYLQMFLTDDTIENIVVQTNLYPTQKSGGQASISVSKSEMEQFLGIHLLSSIVKVPSFKLYWNSKMRYGPIADVMS